MFISLRRITRFGWDNFKRQKELSFATILVVVITILLVTSLFLTAGLTRFLLTNLQEKFDVGVYFKNGCDTAKIQNLKDKLLTMPEVKNVEYISSEEALQRFELKHKNNPTIMESIKEYGGNPFPASLAIKAKSPDQYQPIVKFLQQDEFKDLIKKIDYVQRKPIIEKVSRFSATVKRVGIILSAILSFIAVLVAFSTIRLAIYSSREEVEIQRLVGASDWFIQGPFLVHGLIAGFFSVLISILLTFGICYFLNPRLETLTAFNLMGFFQNQFLLILLIQLGVGLGIGAFSSFIATRRYLKI